MMRPSLATALLICAIVLASEGPARAGSYSVKTCQGGSDPVFLQAGFNWFTNDRAYTEGYAPTCGGAGFLPVRANTGTYTPGSSAGYAVNAPAGTVFTSFRGSFGSIIRNSANVLPWLTVWETFGARNWTTPLTPADWTNRADFSWNSFTSGFSGRTIAFYLQCNNSPNCSFKSTDDARLAGGSFFFTLEDQALPVPQALGGSLVDDSTWKRGVQRVTLRTRDVGGGVKRQVVRFSTGLDLTRDAPCAQAGGFYASTTPCPYEQTDTFDIDTARQLPDGVATLNGLVLDAGDNLAGTSSRTLRVDNTTPAAPVNPQLGGGAGWRKVNGFAVSWENPSGQAAPIVAAHWRACPAGTTADPRCVSGTERREGITSLSGINLPAPGQWDLRIWLEDAAGNGNAAEPQRAGAPLALRWDPEPPALNFRQPDVNDPVTAVADARDASGIVDGQIEIGRVGSGNWQSLPTTRNGSTLSAPIPDDRLPAGTYRLRARAVDAAGNEGSAEGLERSLPIRFGTRMAAAALAKGKRRCRSRRARCRPRTVSRSTLRARYGARVTLTGALTTSDGQGLRSAPVLVSFNPVAGRSRSLGPTRTDSRGSLRYRLTARRSGIVVFRFPGSRRILPSSRSVRLMVPAPVTIGVRRRLLFNGETANFAGRVRGGYIPAAGKLIEIQAYFRGAWRTISTTRSNRRGRWRFAYTFGATTGTVGYRFRARAPAEGGYPFAGGASRTVRVTVRGL